MPEYIVKQGDCLSSIADKYGLFWEKIWSHPKNAKLKEKRKDPNILYPGDVVFIPEKEKKEESCATEKCHRFRFKGSPAKLRLRIIGGLEDEEPQQRPASSPPSHPQNSKDFFGEDPKVERKREEDRPRANVPFVLEIDGNLIEGRTDGDGKIECSISPGAQRGRLTLEPGTTKQITIPLYLGYLNPLSEVSGVKQRLANLGFDCGDRDERTTPRLEAALKSFQEKHGLNVTGEVDQATKDKLRDLHGS